MRQNLGSEYQRRLSDCAEAQADLRVYCSHIAKNSFSHDVALILKEMVSKIIAYKFEKLESFMIICIHL